MDVSVTFYSRLCWLGVSVMHLSVLPLDKSILKQPVLHQTVLFYIRLCCPGRVCSSAVYVAIHMHVLQQSALPMNMYIL